MEDRDRMKAKGSKLLKKFSQVRYDRDLDRNHSHQITSAPQAAYTGTDSPDENINIIESPDFPVPSLSALTVDEKHPGDHMLPLEKLPSDVNMEGVVEDNTDLLAILEEYKILLSTQSEENDLLHLEIADLRANLDQSEHVQHNEQQQEELSDAKKQMAAALAEVQARTEASVRAAEMNAQLQNENHELRIQMSALQGSMETNQLEMQRVTVQAAQLEGRITELESLVSDYEKTIADLQQEHRSQQTSLAIETQLLDARSQVSDLERELERIQADHLHEMAEMAKEKLELDGLRIFATECDVDADKIKEMRNRIAQQDSIILELNELRKESLANEELLQQKERYEQELQRLTDENVRLNTEMHDLHEQRQRLDDLQEELRLLKLEHQSCEQRSLTGKTDDSIIEELHRLRIENGEIEHLRKQVDELKRGRDVQNTSELDRLHAEFDQLRRVYDEQMIELEYLREESAQVEHDRTELDTLRDLCEEQRAELDTLRIEYGNLEQAYDGNINELEQLEEDRFKLRSLRDHILRITEETRHGDQGIQDDEQQQLTVIAGELARLRTENTNLQHTEAELTTALEHYRQQSAGQEQRAVDLSGSNQLLQESMKECARLQLDNDNLRAQLHTCSEDIKQFREQIVLFQDASSQLSHWKLEAAKSAEEVQQLQGQIEEFKGIANQVDHWKAESAKAADQLQQLKDATTHVDYWKAEAAKMSQLRENDFQEIQHIRDELRSATNMTEQLQARKCELEKLVHEQSKQLQQGPEEEKDMERLYADLESAKKENRELKKATSKLNSVALSLVNECERMRASSSVAETGMDHPDSIEDPIIVERLRRELVMASNDIRAAELSISDLRQMNEKLTEQLHRTLRDQRDKDRRMLDITNQMIDRGERYLKSIK